MNNSLTKDFITYGVGNILYTLVNLLLVPVFLEKLDVTDYGILSISLVTENLIMILFSLSISNGILRAFNEGYTLKKEQTFFSTALIFFILIEALFILISYTLKEFLSQIIFETKNYCPFIVLIIIIGFSRILDSLNLGVLRARNKSLQYVLLNISNIILLAAINLIIIYFTQFTLISILWGYVISGLISNIIGFAFNYSDFRLEFRLESLKYFIRYGFPLGIASAISYFINYGNRYFLMNYTSKTDVALIDISQKIASLVGVLLTGAFLTVFTPYYLNLYNKVPKEEFSKRINEKIITFSVLFFFLGLNIIMFQDLGLSLLSKSQYLIAANYVPYLILSNYFFVLFMMLTLGTNINKKTKVEMYITILIFILSIIANIILIQSFGIYGAVYTQIFINLLSVLLIQIYNKKYFPLTINFNSLFKLIIIFISLSIAKTKIPILFNINNLFVTRGVLPFILIGIYIFLYQKEIFSIKSKLLLLVK